MERFLKSRYKTAEKISENPFSVSYKGYFIGTNKPVIIKIYKRGTLNSTLIKHMKQKVKEFSFITHHGIAKMIDGDYGWQGFYYVREFVEGNSLEDLLSQGIDFGVEKSLAIASQACLALDFAHKKGIVLGAVKPSNIFVDSQGVVKLADFVIEGEVKEALPQKVLSIMQNGYYVSPEELCGQAASSSADIYALGLVLNQLMTHDAPNKEPGMMRSLLKLKEGAVFNQTSLNKLPRYLQDILKKALQRDPLLRFASAAEFGQSLEKKALFVKQPAHQEYISIFDNTVTQYGGEDVTSEHEEFKDLGRVRLRWGKEKHRHWILSIVLALSILSGLLYAFFLGR